MQNSANENSQNAKKAGITYWEYMAKTYPGCVKKLAWGVVEKKSLNPNPRLLSQLRKGSAK